MDLSGFVFWTTNTNVSEQTKIYIIFYKRKNLCVTDELKNALKSMTLGNKLVSYYQVN